MVATPFVGIFAGQVIEAGLAVTLFTWLAVFVLCGLIIGGINLMMDD